MSCHVPAIPPRYASASLRRFGVLSFAFANEILSAWLSTGRLSPWISPRAEQTQVEDEKPIYLTPLRPIKIKRGTGERSDPVGATNMRRWALQTETNCIIRIKVQLKIQIKNKKKSPCFLFWNIRMRILMDLLFGNLNRCGKAKKTFGQDLIFLETRFAIYWWNFCFCKILNVSYHQRCNLCQSRAHNPLAPTAHFIQVKDASAR